MKHITELEKMIGDMMDSLMKDPKRVGQAKEIANLAGKMLNSQRQSMDYANMHGKKQVLPFMERGE